MRANWSGEAFCRARMELAIWPYYSDESIKDSPEAQAWIAELAVANAARRDAAIAAETERRAKAVQDRADWIAAHGSARLQRLVAEGIAHDKIGRASCRERV